MGERVELFFLPLILRLVLAAPAVPVGRPAPPVVLKTSRGSETHLRLKGRPHLLLFFTSWCGRCPQYVTFVSRYAELKRRGIELVPIDLLASELPGEAEALWRRIGVPATLYFDRYGEVTQAYQVTELPTAVLVNRDGRVAGTLAGVHGKKDLSRLLRLAR